MDTPLVLKQAYFGRIQVLEFLIHNKVIGKPVPEYPPIRELADRTFDESQLPSLWKDARARCPGTKCVGYYFTLDEGGKVDANLTRAQRFLCSPWMERSPDSGTMCCGDGRCFGRPARNKALDVRTGNGLMTSG